MSNFLQTAVMICFPFLAITTMIIIHNSPAQEFVLCWQFSKAQQPVDKAEFWNMPFEPWNFHHHTLPGLSLIQSHTAAVWCLKDPNHITQSSLSFKAIRQTFL
ncbi:hypothetical protein LIER_32872 [Lithospermum erythrorhizon]|uniref:Secreted protein n=1 Tax=Lithospermum erythrorhizon TaxID=34254 RepID=A0AAV3RYS6_LITER